MTPQAPRRNFSLRTLMLWTLLVAITLGWLRTSQTYSTNLRRAQERLMNLELNIEQLYLDSDRDIGSEGVGRSRFLNADLSHCHLASVRYESDSPAFQNVKLADANLERAVLVGSGASFQSACFDRAKMKGAHLRASGSAFQNVTFVEANLTDAIIQGGSGADLQNVSFRRANLTGAKIICQGPVAFTGVDLDAAILIDADLSSIDSENLAGAYFNEPPSYSKNTKLPAGFDPKKTGWTLVTE